MSINIFNILGGSTNSADTLIPDRDSNSGGGSIFLSENSNIGGQLRELNTLHECLSGNIPNILRNFAAVKVTEGLNTITYLVMVDYLSIGSDEDYVRMPMNPHTAQAIADKYDCTLPTTKMVNDIWKNAVNKLNPLAIPPDALMMSTPRIAAHNTKIQAQLQGKDLTVLTSGDKKDVVLTNQLFPNNPRKRVAIYGWIMSNGLPIQGLNAGSHEDVYADYSHGIRMIANDVVVNGKPMRIQDVFSDKKLSSLISNEGPLLFQRY